MTGRLATPPIYNGKFCGWKLKLAFVWLKSSKIYIIPAAHLYPNQTFVSICRVFHFSLFYLFLHHCSVCKHFFQGKNMNKEYFRPQPIHQVQHSKNNRVFMSKHLIEWLGPKINFFPETLTKDERACFFNTPTWLNPTTNTPIPVCPARLFIFSPDRKTSRWNFPRLWSIHLSPDIPDIEQTGVRTVLCSH